MVDPLPDSWNAFHISDNWKAFLERADLGDISTTTSRQTLEHKANTETIFPDDPENKKTYV